MAGLVPERVVQDLLILGVAAIQANPEVLEDIAAGLDTAEIAKVVARFVARPPKVVLGFANTDQPFPQFAIWLANDTESTVFLDDAERTLDDDEYYDVGDTTITEARDRRFAETIAITIMDDHPLMIAYWYRVCKRILLAGVRYMTERGLDSVRISGADIAPNEQMKHEGLFSRRASVSYEYEDRIPVDDPLWLALYPDPAAQVTTGPDRGSLVNIFHEDIGFEDDEGHVVIGGVHPVSEADLDDEDDDEE